MSDDPYGRSRLPYPYSYVQDDVFPLAVSVALPDTQGEHTSPCDLLILSLDTETLTKLTSALQAGLDLIYPDEWQTLMEWWSAALWLRNTGRYVACDGASIVSICDIVTDCILNNPGTNDAVREVVQDAVDGQRPPFVEQEGSTSDDRDCVYGALVDTYELVKDAWLELQVIIQTAASFAELIAAAGNILPIVGPFAAEVLEQLYNLGVTQVDSWIEQQSTQDTWVCTAFCLIVGRGEPYTITSNDLLAALDAIQPSEPIPGVVFLLKPVFRFGLAVGYWSIRTDDSCSNDWQALCDCGPDWCETLDLSDPATQGLFSFGPTFTAAWSARGMETVGQFVSGVNRNIGQITLNSAGYDLSGVETVDVNYTIVSSSGGGTSRVIGSVALGNSPLVSYPRPPGSSTFAVEVSGLTGLDVQLQASAGSQLGEGYISSIVLCGTGTNPFAP